MRGSLLILFAALSGAPAFAAPKGQVVTTGPGESRKVSLPGGETAVLIGPSSEVVIDSPTQVTLNRGSLLATVSKISEKAAAAADAENRPSRFKVRARTVVMGVRGTSFFVRSEEKKPLFLCPCEGEISLSHAGTQEAYRLKGVHHDIPKDIDTDSLKTGRLSQVLRPSTTKNYGHSDEDINALKGMLSQKEVGAEPALAKESGKEIGKEKSKLHRDLMFRYGVISDEEKISAFPGTKFFAFAYRKQLKLFTMQLEVGGIFDPRPGTKNSGFVNFSNGFEIRTDPVSLFYLPGVTLITGPDRYLTTFYQFSHDLGITVRDERGVSFLFAYRHFSNCGIELPNPGRNFLIFSIALPAAKLGL